jgi:hypothetical protein
MLRRGVISKLPVLAAVGLVLAFGAHIANANGSHVVKASVELISTGSLAGISVPAGAYSVTADDSKIMFQANGKMVAEAAIEWKETESKADVSNLVLDGTDIREIHFRGQKRYAVVAR